jgi:predicted RNA binding protein YcfA (HicA-like mRNA interferase family)
MGTLPQISGKKLISMLKKLGYEKISQKGSHVKLLLYISSSIHHIIIPNHKVIAKGTLNDILNKVSIWTQKSKDELIDLLK